MLILHVVYIEVVSVSQNCDSNDEMATGYFLITWILFDREINVV